MRLLPLGQEHFLPGVERWLCEETVERLKDGCIYRCGEVWFHYFPAATRSLWCMGGTYYVNLAFRRFQGLLDGDVALINRALGVLETGAFSSDEGPVPFFVAASPTEDTYHLIHLSPGIDSMVSDSSGELSFSFSEDLFVSGSVGPGPYVFESSLYNLYLHLPFSEDVEVLRGWCSQPSRVVQRRRFDVLYALDLLRDRMGRQMNGIPPLTVSLEEEFFSRCTAEG